MTFIPCLVRGASPVGEARYALGHPLVDRYLEFVAGRSRPNTLRAVTFDLKTFAVWLPPQGMTARFERFDPRPGGSYRLVLTYLDALRATARRRRTPTSLRALLRHRF